MKRQPPQPPPRPGEIAPGHLYTLPELQARLGLGYRGMRALQESGLKLVSTGKCKYALGSSVIRFFENLEQGNHDAN